MNTILFFSNSITLVILIVGAGCGLIWLFIRPQLYKRAIEPMETSASKEASNGSEATAASERLKKIIPLSTAIITIAVAGISIWEKAAVHHLSTSSDAKVEISSDEHKKLPQRVVSFQSTYVQFARPHPRVWREISAAVWTESYDGQISNYFDEEGVLSQDGCDSLLLRKRGEPEFEVLVSAGETCKWALQFRWNAGNWKPLGDIQDASFTQK